MSSVDPFTSVVCVSNSITFSASASPVPGTVRVTYIDSCCDQTINEGPDVITGIGYTWSLSTGASGTGSSLTTNLLTAGTYVCTFTALATNAICGVVSTNLVATGTVVQVEPSLVDASDPSNTKLYYAVFPWGETLPECTFIAPGGVNETKTVVSGSFYFEYDQHYLDEGDNFIRLEYLGCQTGVTATKHHFVGGPAQEIAVAWVPVDNEGGSGVAIVPVAVTHTLTETYERITYNIEMTALSRTLQVGRSIAKIETAENTVEFWIDLALETHWYLNQFNQTYNYGFMPLSGDGLPGSAPWRWFFLVVADDFFDADIEWTGFARISTLQFKAGMATGITNPAVDQHLD